jgi:hypothetical protein
LRLPFGDSCTHTFAIFGFSCPFQHFTLLLTDYSVVLRIESSSLLLEDLSANSLMLVDAVNLELASTALAAGHQVFRVHLILSHVEIFLFIDIGNALLLQLLQLTSSLYFTHDFNWHGSFTPFKISIRRCCFVFVKTFSLGSSLTLKRINFMPWSGIVAFPDVLVTDLWLSPDFHALLQ